MDNNKPFTVSITNKGSKRALPAIWYGGRATQWFNVIRSKDWPSMYEVINGKHTGKLIDPKDCEKITIWRTCFYFVSTSIKTHRIKQMLQRRTRRLNSSDTKASKTL